MTAATLEVTPAHVPSPIAHREDLAGSLWKAFEIGVKISGLGKAAPVFVGADDVHLLFEVDTSCAAERLCEYFVASKLISMSATPYKIDVAPEHEVSRLHFFDSWSKKMLSIGEEQQIEVLSFDCTEPLEPVSQAALAIDWGTDVTLPSARPKAPSVAFKAFTELRNWLHLTVPEAAELVGVGKTTPVTSWQSLGHPPRPKTARRLFQLHALVAAVVRQLGARQAYEWMSVGPQPKLNLLREGSFDAFADEVERLTIRHPPRTGTVPGGEVAPAEDATLVPVGGNRRRAPARRRG